jgi:hypothetical protein
LALNHPRSTKKRSSAISTPITIIPIPLNVSEPPFHVSRLFIFPWLKWFRMKDMAAKDKEGDYGGKIHASIRLIGLRVGTMAGKYAMNKRRT